MFSDLTVIGTIGVITGYLFGSVSMAVLVARVMRLPDPRAHGSQNPGATNVLRLGGKTAGVLVLLGDMLKAVLPLAVLMNVAMPIDILYATFVAAFLGHLFPIFFRFQGGKGVATFLGGLVILSPALAAVFGATWLLTALLTRYASLASLLGSLAVVVMSTPLADPHFAIASGVMTLLLWWPHRENLQRLWHGQESKLGAR